jgi:hypothetical protein
MNRRQGFSAAKLASMNSPVEGVDHHVDALARGHRLIAGAKSSASHDDERRRPAAPPISTGS